MSHPITPLSLPGKPPALASRRTVHPHIATSVADALPPKPRIQTHEPNPKLSPLRVSATPSILATSADKSAPVPPAAPSGSDDRLLPKEIVDSIVTALAGLDFGSVEITVHNARIVQIERHERIRFGAVPAKPATTGGAAAVPTPPKNP